MNINGMSVSEIKEVLYILLSNNKLLVKEFSKLGIKRRIEKNIKNIQIQVNKEGNSGAHYRIVQKKIVFNTSPKISLDLEVLQHEGIHALLSSETLRTIQTGMFKVRFAPNLARLGLFKTRFLEIGRGINEGFTNWLIEQGGYNVMSYPTLTTINRILGLCIGNEKMMYLARGNYRKVFNSFHMSKDYGIEFLRKIDEIYFADENIDKLQYFNDINIYGEIHRKNYIINDVLKIMVNTLVQRKLDETVSLNDFTDLSKIVKNIYNILDINGIEEPEFVIDLVRKSEEKCIKALNKVHEETLLDVQDGKVSIEQLQKWLSLARITYNFMEINHGEFKAITETKKYIKEISAKSDFPKEQEHLLSFLIDHELSENNLLDISIVNKGNNRYLISGQNIRDTSITYKQDNKPKAEVTGVPIKLMIEDRKTKAQNSLVPISKKSNIFTRFRSRVYRMYEDYIQENQRNANKTSTKKEARASIQEELRNYTPINNEHSQNNGQSSNVRNTNLDDERE